MIAQVEQVVVKDHQLGVHGVISKHVISVGCMESILHDDLKIQKVFI